MIEIHDKHFNSSNIHIQSFSNTGNDIPPSLCNTNSYLLDNPVIPSVSYRDVSTTKPPVIDQQVIQFGPKAGEYVIHSQDAKRNFTEQEMSTMIWKFAESYKLELESQESVNTTDKSNAAMHLPKENRFDDIRMFFKYIPRKVGPRNRICSQLGVIEYAEQISPYVCRIVGINVGSGFIVGDLPGCIITNCHVIESWDHLKKTSFYFYDQSGVDRLEFKFNSHNMIGYQVLFPEIKQSMLNTIRRFFNGKTRPSVETDYASCDDRPGCGSDSI